MTSVLDPALMAQRYRSALREEVATLKNGLKLVGFLSSDNPPSITYSDYTRTGCEDVNIQFELRSIDKLALEEEIDQANSDPGVHGIIVYYPIFGTERDGYIKDLVSYTKDIEGLNSKWSRMLYHNERFVDGDKNKKAILPCTPLAIIKLLEEALGSSGLLKGKSVTVFNRSEVVGRPLASMLSNDGARVYSFDIGGALLFEGGKVSEIPITREEALSKSDIVITGVPSRGFRLVQAHEIKPGAICLNFSTMRNFDPDIIGRAGHFIPRVGPMTVTMALRNTLRLYHNFHSGEGF